MTKKYRVLMLGLISAAILTGCSKSGSSDDTNNNTPETASVSDNSAADDAAENADGADITAITEEETEPETLAPITPSDYLIEEASDYVTLASYDGIEAIQYTYTVTDDMVQEQIQSALEDAGTEEDTGAPAAEGDTVYLTLKSTVEGSASDPEDTETYFVLGEAEYSPEFDQELTGLSAGDTKKFSLSFDDDIWVEAWAGQTVNFEAAVTQVTHLSVPEYDDTFISEYTDFTTKKDYEEAIRAFLEEEYLQTSYSDVIDYLFTEAMEKTAFDGYPQELYDSCRDEVLSSYAVFAGDDEMDIEDILDAFGITDEDIDAETLDQVNRRLLVSAYCKENNIEVTEDDYVSYTTENAAYYGIASATEFENLYTRDALVWNLYESKVAEQLYQAARITETEYSEEDLLTADDFVLEEEETALSEADSDESETA